MTHFATDVTDSLTQDMLIGPAFPIEGVLSPKTAQYEAIINDLRNTQQLAAVRAIKPSQHAPLLALSYSAFEHYLIAGQVNEFIEKLNNQYAAAYAAEHSNTHTDLTPATFKHYLQEISQQASTEKKLQLLTKAFNDTQFTQALLSALQLSPSKTVKEQCASFTETYGLTIQCSELNAVQDSAAENPQITLIITENNLVLAARRQATQNQLTDVALSTVKGLDSQEGEYNYDPTELMPQANDFTQAKATQALAKSYAKVTTATDLTYDQMTQVVSALNLAAPVSAVNETLWVARHPTTGDCVERSASHKGPTYDVQLYGEHTIEDAINAIAKAFATEWTLKGKPLDKPYLLAVDIGLNDKTQQHWEDAFAKEGFTKLRLEGIKPIRAINRGRLFDSNNPQQASDNEDAAPGPTP